MGPHKKDRQLLALLAEKDSELEKLHISLHAHIAHSVATNSRLAMALDTLDSVQSRNELELAVYAEDTERLQKTLARYRKVVKLAEIQRDDLRDAVVKLSEQIELSNNDFTSWSHSRIHIPRLAEPLQDLPNDISKITSERELWAYASGMIRFLRASLDIERRAHKETLRSARASIARLEAQVASRDAELEACLMHSGQAFPRASTSARNLPPLPPSPPPISVPDMNDALKQTAVENVALEAEMERLAALLDQARGAVAPSDARQTAAGSSNGTVRAPPPDIRPTTAADVEHQPPARPDSRRRKRERQNSEPRDARRRSSPRRRSASPARPRRPPSPRTVHGHDFDPDRTVRPDRPRATESVPTTTESMHASLNREIAALGAKIDDFHLEKTRLLEQVQAVEREDNANPVNPRERRPTEPQQQPRQHRHWAQTQPILPPEPHVVVQGRLLEDYDGEMSMELATPLVPTVMLPQAIAGPSTLPPPPAPTGHFVFAPPPPVSTEISPLDLSTDRPLPGSDSQTHPEPWGREVEVEQPGDSEQAVQELMNIAHARRRES
ncbi:hypothetical protein DFH06DRAFT_554904 [Mycena polygramma]|nr:hypothetical protein DFH06DRAFT_554904 [Mycena polygramma]